MSNNFPDQNFPSTVLKHDKEIKIDSNNYILDDDEEEEVAVDIRDAFKSYGSKKKPTRVLVDFNMSVEKGTIYGLLGASGCGKTTILSCIVGMRKLDKGDISVFGQKPSRENGIPGKRVGYMPQEIALCEEFTIKETMQYFGWIAGMRTSEIKDRITFLLTFLDLPSQNRLVKNLSGGQKRRVSFAVALPTLFRYYEDVTRL